MLSLKNRGLLEYSLRMTLCDKLTDKFIDNPQLEKFITEDITYSQMLNVMFNQHKGRYKLSDGLLEAIAINTIFERLKPISEGMGDFTIYGIISNAVKRARFIGHRYPGVKTFSKWVTVGIGAAVAARYVYNNLLSKYIKACKNVPKDQLQKCIKNVKIQSHQQVLRALKSAQPTCKYLDNKEEIELCTREYQQEIQKILDKIEKLKR